MIPWPSLRSSSQKPPEGFFPWRLWFLLFSLPRLHFLLLFPSLLCLEDILESSSVPCSLSGLPFLRLFLFFLLSLSSLILSSFPVSLFLPSPVLGLVWVSISHFCQSVCEPVSLSVCNHFSPHPPPYIELSYSSSLCWYIYSPQTSQIQTLKRDQLVPV